MELFTTIPTTASTPKRDINPKAAWPMINPGVTPEMTKGTLNIMINTRRIELNSRSRQINNTKSPNGIVVRIAKFASPEPSASPPFSIFTLEYQDAFCIIGSTTFVTSLKAVPFVGHAKT